MACHVVPSVRRLMMRSATARSAAGRPRTRPCRRSSANFPCWRSEIRRFSKSAASASIPTTSAPLGEALSRPTSRAISRQPSFSARLASVRTSAAFRPSRSIFATTNPEARPASISASAACSPGRFVIRAPLKPSSANTGPILRSLASPSAFRCAAMPIPEVACAKDEQRT